MNDFFVTVVVRIREDAAAGLLLGCLQTDPIESSVTLAELGVDSLSRMALLTALMHLTDQYTPDTAFTEGQTPCTIVEQVAAMVGPG